MASAGGAFALAAEESAKATALLAAAMQSGVPELLAEAMANADRCSKAALQGLAEQMLSG